MTRLSLIWTAFLSVTTVTVFGQKANKYDKIVDSLSQAGQLDKLIPYFQKELISQPKSESVLRWLGFLYIGDNQLDIGEKYYREALTVNPKCGRCYLNIGKVYTLKNDNKKALEYLDMAVSTDPTDGLLYSERGKLKAMMGDKFGGLFDYDKAIELDTQNADYYIQRGLYYSNHGYAFIALTDLNKAVELAPKNYYPYYQRGSIYYSLQRFNESLADITTAMQLDSNQFSLYTARGAIYAVFKEHEKAMSDYTKAIKLNPNDYLPYYNRSLEKMALEDMDGFCADIHECYTVLNKYDANNSLKKEIESSIREFCDSTKPSYYYQRGIAFYNLQQFEKAIAIYSSGLKKFSNNSMILSFRGNAYYTLKDFNNALPDYYLAIQNKENVIADVRNNPHYKNASADSINMYVKGFLASMQISIAESKFALRQYHDALTEINKGIEIAPDIKEFGRENYYNVRGNILLALGKYDEAKNDFDKCLQLNPYFHFAYINRAVAKINLANQIKMTSHSIRGGIDDLTFNADWTLPLNTTVKKSDSNIISALTDCNKAIEIDSKSDYAYYIRGQIKKMLIYGDYCIDLLKAKELGYPLEQELLDNCN